MASSSLLPRIVIGTAIALTVASGVMNLKNGGAVKEIKTQRDAAKSNAVALSEQTKKVTDEAKAAKEELKTIAEAKAAAEVKFAAATAEVDKVKKDLDAAVAKAQDQDTKLKELVAAQNSAPAPTPVVAPTPDPELLKKVADAEAKAAEKEAIFKTLQTKSEDAEKKTAALEADAARRTAGLTKPGLEGKVLAVNPNWNFVVLSIGDRQGVVSGSNLIVKRGGVMVAKLHVTSVEPSTSIADIQSGSLLKGSTVQPGDVVIFPGS